MRLPIRTFGRVFLICLWPLHSASAEQRDVLRAAPTSCNDLCERWMSLGRSDEARTDEASGVGAPGPEPVASVPTSQDLRADNFGKSHEKRMAKVARTAPRPSAAATTPPRVVHARDAGRVQPTVAPVRPAAAALSAEAERPAVEVAAPQTPPEAVPTAPRSVDLAVQGQPSPSLSDPAPSPERVASRHRPVTPRSMAPVRVADETTHDPDRALSVDGRENGDGPTPTVSVAMAGAGAGTLLAAMTALPVVGRRRRGNPGLRAALKASRCAMAP